MAKRPAKVPAAPAVRIETIPISRIALDPALQMRVATSEEIIEQYAEAIADGIAFPPVTVFRIDGEPYLVDGWHRFLATDRAGLAEITCEVREGDRDDATLYAVGANATHGHRRSNADKRRAVETLLHSPKWSTWSNVEIAKTCGVAESYVRKIKADHTSHNARYDQNSDQRTFIHPKTGQPSIMNIGGIREAAKSRNTDQPPAATRRTEVEEPYRITPAPETARPREEVVSYHVTPEPPVPLVAITPDLIAKMEELEAAEAKAAAVLATFPTKEEALAISKRDGIWVRANDGKDYFFSEPENHRKLDIWLWFKPCVEPLGKPQHTPTEVIDSLDPFWVPRVPGMVDAAIAYLTQFKAELEARNGQG